VAELAFASGPGGKKSLAGTAQQFLNLGRPGFLGQISPHSEASVQKGLTRLNQLCEHMHLNIHVREAGRRMYQLAWQMNFIAGRPKTLVAAACLYTICRRNKSPHLMIDFSDALRVPVVKIGRTYLRLMRRLTGRRGAWWIQARQSCQSSTLPSLWSALLGGSTWGTSSGRCRILQ